MTSAEYIEVKREDFDKYAGAGCLQAGHCMIYARLPSSYFEDYSLRAAVLMQMRFDGHVGFPGGLIEPGEEVLKGLLRELEEEINFDTQRIELSEQNYVISHWCVSEKILLHFYVLEVSEKQMKDIERRALDSLDYGKEVMGTFRVPLYTMHDGVRGFPTFLKNSFVGNSFLQLRTGLSYAAIMSEEEMKTAVSAACCKNS